MTYAEIRQCLNSAVLRFDRIVRYTTEYLYEVEIDIPDNIVDSIYLRIKSSNDSYSITVAEVPMRAQGNHVYSCTMRLSDYQYAGASANYHIVILGSFYASDKDSKTTIFSDTLGLLTCPELSVVFKPANTVAKRGRDLLVKAEVREFDGTIPHALDRFADINCSVDIVDSRTKETISHNVNFDNNELLLSGSMTDRYGIYLKILETGSLAAPKIIYFNLLDFVSTSKAVYPAAVTVNASESVDFVWTHTIEDDTPPSKSELQYSSDGISWLPLITIDGSDLNCTVSGGTFATGNWWWRVRTFSESGQEGTWSEPASFLPLRLLMRLL